MKSGITVAEAKQHKRKLEIELLGQIKAFEAETGCLVIDVKLHSNQMMEASGKGSVLYDLFLECQL